MKINVGKIIKEINSKYILVIGDFIIDEFLIGKVERINPEAPVPILNVKNEKFLLGGAGNVMRNLLSLNANVFVSTVIGDDDDIEIMKDLILKNAVSTEGIFEEKNRKTSRKTRLISEHQHLIRYDRESKHNITDESEEKIYKYTESIIDKIDAVILEDYGKGVLTESLLTKIINLSNKNGKFLLIDPNKSNWTPYTGATIITPNKKEASNALGYAFDNEKMLEDGGFELMKKYKLENLLITRSDEGMSLFKTVKGSNKKEKIDIPTKALDVFDVSGAGDTVIASLAVALSCGLDVEEASHFSNISAGIVVSKSGTATVSFDEIINFMENDPASMDKAVLNNNNNKNGVYYLPLKFKKNKSFSEIKDIAQKLKDRKKTVCFTNGCFDIIHAGHINYLETASGYCDVLVVGLNSDDSVKRLKGNDRPINNIEDRIEVLSALSFIDYIVVFNEDTPYELIKIIIPDVLIKGGDYKIEEIVGYDIVKNNNGKVITLPFIKGKSSTNIINKLKGF